MNDAGHAVARSNSFEYVACLGGFRPKRGDVTRRAADRPDLCLLGLEPGDQSSGLDAVPAIRQRYPGTKVLVLSAATDPATLSQLMRSGVADLTHQDQSVDQIASTLDAIAAGQNGLNPGPLQGSRVRVRGRRGGGRRRCRVIPAAGGTSGEERR
jgi:DNA-binding NarL/FixJ family response regulator